MNEALKRAEKGGWKFLNSERLDVVDGVDTRIGIKLPPRITAFYSDGYARNVGVGEVVFDPEFWQALGKAEGWEGSTYSYRNNNPQDMNGYLVFWHRFIDHLADGGTPDTFFAALFTKGEQR